MPAGADDASRRIYIWDVSRDQGRGFAATLLVFDRQTNSPSSFGTYIVVDQNGADELGRRGTVRVFNVLKKYADEYEIDKFYKYANMPACFFRMLCLPKVILQSQAADEKGNRERRRRGRETIAPQRIVRISDQAFQYRALNMAAKHVSPKEHYQRAHRLGYANGRETTIRGCMVKRG